MQHIEIKIGTRESELAIWQAKHVQQLLTAEGYTSSLVYIKSEGDFDLTTPLYEMGVQGIFTRALDVALLDGRIDIAVHSMKDVPTMLPKGIAQAAVLKRGRYQDVLVPHPSNTMNFSLTGNHGNAQFTDAVIATSSVRRRAQWLHRYPGHQIVNLRGNINTRLKKLRESNWQGAVFAAAGLERINLLPDNAMVIDWMLPAPAQGAIVVVCREKDTWLLDGVQKINDHATSLCVKIERDFLRALMGGCATPISALAEINNNSVFFKGNLLSPDGSQKVEVETVDSLSSFSQIGFNMAQRLLDTGGREIIKMM